MLHSRDVALLRSDVAANCRVWQERCREAGLNVLVTSTVRDQAYQEYLYQQGRTRPGAIITNGRVPTFHSDKAGLAWDFCKNVKGQEYSDPDFFRQAAAIAKGMGFSWGGDWQSFPDQPHIQWDLHGKWTNAMIRAGELPPSMPPAQPAQSEEEEPMDIHQFEALWQQMRQELQDNDSSPYSEEARKWAVEKGLITGGGQTGYMWEDMMTREQMVTVLYRFAQLAGLLEENKD